MYIPLWLLWIVGFSVVGCVIEVIVKRAEKERNLQKRIKEIEEKGKPVRLSTDNVPGAPEDDPSDL